MFRSGRIVIADDREAREAGLQVLSPSELRNQIRKERREEKLFSSGHAKRVYRKR